ncbi:hypothetical protein BRARA_F02935 [Brassica rapa]|uniref:Uncharacterized protein n=1 Tax=Brassica campestris TaxID=3711 RepID=A0A397Z2R1_BRACM|nr:hypothetical protein BRARA_F02935 [Brassica rapa]
MLIITIDILLFKYIFHLSQSLWFLCGYNSHSLTISLIFPSELLFTNNLSSLPIFLVSPTEPLFRNSLPSISIALVSPLEFLLQNNFIRARSCSSVSPYLLVSFTTVLILSKFMLAIMETIELPFQIFAAGHTHQQEY